MLNRVAENKKIMGCHYSDLTPTASNAAFELDFFERLAHVRAENPSNLCAKYLTQEYVDSLSPSDKRVLYKCIITGVDNPDSGLGCYAMQPADYDTFRPFFDRVIREYHGDATGAKQHVTNWDFTDATDLDVTKLGLGELSMRVRVGRNLKQFNLPGMMSKAEHIRFEQTMLTAFDTLIANAAYGGAVYSLTPDFGDGVPNPNLISAEQYQELVDAHIMFKDMTGDPYLESAGISSDWPYGRGCYVSADRQFIIWFGEEDQLRIICMKKSTKLDEVCARLREGLRVVESIEGIDFATSADYGYVTSCPSNLGTAMRASVHVKIPHLTRDGTDTKAKAICKSLGLSVRGIGGEHTPIGTDGTVDISPRARLFVQEQEILTLLYSGIEKLMAAEKQAGVVQLAFE
jgi:creatine kinase